MRESDGWCGVEKSECCIMEMKWFRSCWLLLSNAKLSFCDAFMGPF